MSRVRAFLDRIDDPKLPPLDPGDPRDTALLALLVHLAAVDGTVASDEFALLQRVRADLDPSELLTWVADVAAQPLDLDAVVASTSSIDERWDVLRFAARMVAMDGDVQQLEASRLGELSRKLGLPVSGARQALDEVVATGGPVDEAKVAAAVTGMTWSALAPSSAPLPTEVVGEGPQGAHLCTIRLDDVEVAAIYGDGLWVRFDQGPSFVRWVDLRTYTRVPVPGAVVHLRTWDGRGLTVTDERMRELARLIDRVYPRGGR